MDPFNLAILGVTWLMMLAVGLSMDRQDLGSLCRRPALIAATITLHWIVLPLAALGISLVLRLDPVLSAALLLVAACPVGDIVNFYTLVGRGRVPLSVALNALSCLAAPVGMGLVFAGIQTIHASDAVLSPPGWDLVGRVLLLALLPIGIGMVVRWTWPARAGQIQSPCGRTAGAGILAVLGWALVRQRDHLASIWVEAVPAVLAFLAIGLGAGCLWARWWRLPPAESLPVAVTFPVRNVALAAALATSLLGRPEFLSLIALYFLLEVPLFLLGARFWRAVAKRG
jgi:BASS family bile acid:Na+ symporter